MAISKKLRIDLDILKSVLAECNSVGAQTYIDTETGEILSTRDMLEEEIQARNRFLKVPSEKIWSISEKSVKKWAEDMLPIIAQNYSEDFMLKAKAELEQAIKQTNHVELVTTVLIDLQEEGFNDNYFASWLNFVEKEEISNIRSWLSSKGINLIN